MLSERIYTSGADSAEYEQLSKSLDSVKSKLESMVQRVERGTSAFAKFGSVIGKGVVGGLKGMVSMLGKGAAAMLKLSLRAKKTHSTFSSGIGTLLRYGLGVRSLFALMNKLRSALVDGYKNLARYSSRTNAAISSLMSALTRLKNSFAAAFDPILRAAAPALVTLINLISNAVSKIGMLTAALTGAKTYTKATTIQEDYAKSLDKTSQSAKKAKAALASFDELNILDDNSSDSTKDDGSVDPSKMFEQVPIDSAVLDFADKLKKAFEEADWKGLGTLLGDKINKLVDSVDWSGWGTKIGKGMNAAIQTLYYTVDTVDWVNIGKHLAEAVNSIINEVDWDIFGRLLAKKFTVALDVAGGFLKELDWTAVLQAFTSGFSGFYNELQEWLESKDWHRIGEIITAKLSDALRNGNVEGAVKSFFDAFTEAINSLAELMDGIDFYQVAKDLVEMLIRAVSGVSWDELTEALGRLIGESVDAVIQILSGSLADVGNYFKEKTQEAGGDAVAGFFLGIKDAIFGVGAWIVDNIFKPFWDGICAAFEIHSPSKKMAEIGGYIIAGLLDGIKELPSKLKAKLDDALDKVVSWGSDLKSKVKDAAADAVTKAVDEFRDLASKLKLKLDAAIDKVKDFAKDIASRMKSGAADAVTDAASQLSNLAGKAKEKFDNAIPHQKADAVAVLAAFPWISNERSVRMSFYKILADGKVLDVNDVFLRWQPRHGVMMICSPEKAQFVCPRDCSAYYHAAWLNEPPEGAVYDGDIECEEIGETEYKELLEKLDAGGTVKNPEPDTGEGGSGDTGPGEDNTGDSGGQQKPTVVDMKQLVETCAGLQKQVQMLTDCVLEMSEEVYG